MAAPDHVTIRRGRVRTRGFVRVSRGLYRQEDDSSVDMSVLHGWQDLLPADGCFTGLTAATLRGWALPCTVVDPPTFVAVVDRGCRPRRPGLDVTRCHELVAVEMIRGLRVASTADVLVACARDLRFLDLVALSDAALRQSNATAEEVVRVGQGRRGAAILRLALDHADSRAESPWESMLRMFHRLVGVAVQPQFVISDEGGEYRADLRVVGTRRLVEYDGEVHREPAQHARDLARERRLQRLGWQRFGYTSHALLTGAASVLRDADDALARPHEPGRIRPWHAAVAESVATAAGRAALRARWAKRAVHR